MAIQAQMCPENLGFGLGDSQDLLVNDNNACGFNNIMCLIPQQQKLVQKQQQPLMEFGQFQSLSHQKQSTFTNQRQIMDFSPNISAQIEKQRIEIDRFITLQNDRLRLALQEQRKQQLSLFFKIYESKIQFLFKQKEEEITKAAKRTMELEDFLKRMEIENQTWQRVAKENEAMVVSLNSTIERLREAASLSANAANDAESCCGDDDGEEEDTKVGNREERSTTICRCCNSRDSCVIMLPCRHMCSCKYCEAFLDFCPVCRTVKKATIEALL